jgi:hypothetical protein
VDALDKERYAAGLQCLRRLWQLDHAPERAAAPDPDALERLARGAEIGRQAHVLFPGAVLVDAVEFQAARARTVELLADPGVPALLEAAFEHDGVRVRVDALERLPDGSFGLREVKSATAAKPEHFDDVTLQLYVLRGAGLEVRSLELVLVDGEYARGASGIDWPRFFGRQEVLVDAEYLLDDLPDRLAELRATLAGAEPDVGPSPHCRVPRLCAFWEHCSAGKPGDWIGRLPGMRSTEFQALVSAGVERIPQVPEQFPLKPRQARARAAHLRGGRVVDAGLGEALANTGPPAAYLDFEALAAAVPLFAGMRPYQPIPFQWSLHRVDAHGERSHAEFLAPSAGDPRRAFAESLAAELTRDELPIHVYSSYEANVITGLARALPELAEPLERLLPRLVDLLPIVRDHVYDPSFAGSFSIKRVGPALVPGFGYGDLEAVANGGEAARAIGELVAGSLDPEAALRLRGALLAYCARDTLALVELHRALRELAEDR